MSWGQDPSLCGVGQGLSRARLTLNSQIPPASVSRVQGSKVCITMPGHVGSKCLSFMCICEGLHVCMCVARVCLAWSDKAVRFR